MSPVSAFLPVTNAAMNNFKLSPEGESLIKAFEGFEAKAYPDANGILTIGWGHTGPDVKAGMQITLKRAEVLFQLDTRVAANAVNFLVKAPLTQHQFDALVSFTFNVGVAAFKGSGVLQALNAGHPEAVPEHLKLWDKDAKGRLLPGLQRRRAAEINLWNTI
jgi:lysozyme